LQQIELFNTAFIQRTILSKEEKQAYYQGVLADVHNNVECPRS